MDDLITAQAGLRRQLRAARRALAPAVRQEAARCATERTLHWLAQHIPAWSEKRIGVYRALAEELDTTLLITRLWQGGAQLYLPHVSARAAPLHWQPYHSDTELHPDALKIPAPRDEAKTRVAGMALDLVVVPLVGWDRKGHRIGMGGGFYDRTFAAKIAAQTPLLLGYAFACQEIKQGITPQPWDVRLDGIVSEAASLTIIGE